MGVALHVFIVDGGKIRIEHTFYGETEADAEAIRDLHLRICPMLRTADEAERTIEELEEDVDPPAPEDFEEIAEEAGG